MSYFLSIFISLACLRNEEANLLHEHEAGFPSDKFFTSYFIDSQVFFRIFYFIYGI